MSIETVEEITQVVRTTTDRTFLIRITTPRNGNYTVYADREMIVSDNLGSNFQTGAYQVARRISDVIDETVVVGNKTLSVAELSQAISSLIDKWAEEDKLKQQQ